MSGGSLSISYTVRWNPASPSGVKSKSNLGGTSTSIDGLQSNTRYTFTVSAFNGHVSSEESDETATATSTYSLIRLHQLLSIFSKKVLIKRLITNYCKILIQFEQNFKTWGFIYVFMEYSRYDQSRPFHTLAPLTATPLQINLQCSLNVV